MRGFTFIETSIALGILGVLLLIVASLIQSLPLTRLAKNQDLALSIARHELAALRAGGYAALPQGTTFSHPLLATLPSATTTRTITSYNAETKQVVVSVLWKEPSHATSSVSLTTLITEVGGL